MRRLLAVLALLLMPSVSLAAGTVTCQDGTCTGTQTQANTWTALQTFSAGLTVNGGNVTVDTDTFFVSASLNMVGIGTVSPDAVMEIEKNQNTDTYLRITNTSTGAAARMAVEFVNDTGTQIGYVGVHGSQTGAGIGFANTLMSHSVNSTGVALIASHASGIVRLITGGTATANERLRVTAAGNIGIGTAVPLTAHRLDVEGGHLKVGAAAAQKGITLYDTVDGSAHCVTINTNVLNVAAGACS